jgi:ferric-dicitrate binding protein FerR (iron transport regulator)
VSDYLWDKQGEPDPDVEQLETLLRPLGYRGQGLPPRPPRRRAPLGWIAGGLMVASALVALLVARPWRPYVQRGGVTTAALPPRASWAATVRGVGATVDGQPIAIAGAGESRVAVGGWIETGDSRVQLRVADIGTVDLAPGTRARIIATAATGATGATQHRVQLDHGTLLAMVDAPPRRFVVETKHLVVTDLGCAFTLTVDARGQGRLQVTAGKVALGDGAAHEVVVPAGAECPFSDEGPGTPVPSDGSPVRAPTVADDKPAPKPHAKPKHAAHPRAASAPPAAASHAAAPTRAAAPAHGAAPTTKSSKPAAPGAKPGSKINHDALEGLERSIP